MKCDNCKYKTGYVLGHDECGAGHYTEYCAKGHWENSSTEPQYEAQFIETQLNPSIDLWVDCKDYKEKK